MDDTIFIIIVTYNGMHWIDQCLKSTENYPVIVVDNNSTDETVTFIKTNYPNIKIFEQDKNLGFGQANNFGISKALKQGAEHVFLLNQDAYLKVGSLEKLIQTQKENPEYGILSPIHYNGDGSTLDRTFSNYLGYDYNNYFYADAIKSAFKKIYSVPFVNAAAWLISRKCLETVGGFDPLFFHYGEDDNYCNRVTYHKLIIGVVPEAFVKHDRKPKKSKFIKRYSDDYFKVFKRGRLLYFANPNELDSKLKEHEKNKINDYKKKKFKSLLKLQFRKYDNINKEYKIFTECIERATESRMLSKCSKPNYLKI